MLSKSFSILIWNQDFFHLLRLKEEMLSYRWNKEDILYNSLGETLREKMKEDNKEYILYLNMDLYIS